MSAGDRVIRVVTAAVVVGVALVAAVISYGHAYALVSRAGEHGLTGRLLPLTIDGLILCASLALLDAARRGRKAPGLAWPLLALGIVATVTANCLHGLNHGPLGAIVAAWPAVALIGATELFMRMIRVGRTAPESESAGERAPEPLPEIARDVEAVTTAAVFAGEFAAGRVPSIRRIRAHLGCGQDRAKRAHEQIKALAT